MQRWVLHRSLEAVCVGFLGDFARDMVRWVGSQVRRWAGSPAAQRWVLGG